MDTILNKVGYVRSGENSNMYFKVLDDINNTGGYIILFSKDINFSYCFDNWLPSLDAVKEFLINVDWVDKPNN